MLHLQGVFRPVCCYMLPVLAVLLGAAESSGTRISCAAAGENAPVPDTLAEIEQMLQSHPPAWEHGTARAAIAGALDRQVTVQVRDAMTDEERARLQPLLEFYRRRVDAGLDALEHTPVSAGVLVVKFYSSSLVLKSAAGTVALDFCQGPINNGGEPEVRDDRRTGFYWTLAQRERLARLVDMSLITHRHHDHADYSLARQLVAQGKAVVGPGQLRELWPDLASEITVPDYDQGQRVGPVEIFTMRGRQYSRNTPGADGQREGVPGENPDTETESVVYLLRMGGLVFLQGAENHVPATEWLRRGIAQGWNPDIVLSVGQYQGQRSVDAVLSQRAPAFHIPVHEYELMHEGGGNRTLPRFSGAGRMAFDQHQSMPLFWGEHFHVTSALRSSPSSADDRMGFRLDYATCLGGDQWDQAREIIVCPDGSVLVGMQSCSANMTTTRGAVQPAYAGDDPTRGDGGVVGGDLYLARLSADGRRIEAATYLGGSQQERNVYGMALDRQGQIVVTTATRSSDAPTTPGCFQSKFGGGPSDMLVAKLAGDLTKIIWCTYVGGVGDDFPRGGLTLDAQDRVCVVGTSTSHNFPVTPQAFQTRLNGPRDSAAVMLDANGSALVFGTLLGGSGEDDAMVGVRLDEAGHLHVAGHTRSLDFPTTPDAPQRSSAGGWDCYLAELSADAGQLLFATYLGGRGDDFAEHRPWLAADGSLLLTGACGSVDFPTTGGALARELRGPTDGFLVRLSRHPPRFSLATLLGGAGNDFWLMPTLDAQGNIFLAGSTSSRDFPVTDQAWQKSFGGGRDDGALVVFSPDGTRLLYATYLGGSGDDMIRSLTFGPRGELWVVGSTSSDDFPVTSDALQADHRGKGDAFVARLRLVDASPTPCNTRTPVPPHRRISPNGRTRCSRRSAA